MSDIAQDDAVEEIEEAEAPELDAAPTTDVDGEVAVESVVAEVVEPLADAVPAEAEPVVAEPAEVVPAKPVSPYDKQGDWYVINSYSGYENKVKMNLETRTKSMHLEDRIFEIVIPMEDVVEIKNGKKETVQRKSLPGYVLCRMYLDDDTWYAVRNTPAVTGFVGSGTKPVPLSRREVERFLGGAEVDEEAKAPQFKPEWEMGDSVRVVVGPFADFNGIIESINLDQSKVTVLVDIFGRDTPLELGFTDIQKN
ncbi:MAG: transcription termination/antitermination protein NusG [Acidimicrobiia bacterium]|nr:transcription termination/antitermination protein NusG [Acidimicrobiia bacterium]